MQGFEEKTYEFDGRKFTARRPSLAVENRWLEFAIDENGVFNRKVIRDITRDEEAVNWFMERLLSYEGERIDWYNADGANEIIGEVIAGFFTRWSEKMTSLMDTLSTGLEPELSPQSVEAEEVPSGTA